MKIKENLYGNYWKINEIKRELWKWVHQLKLIEIKLDKSQVKVDNKFLYIFERSTECSSCFVYQIVIYSFASDGFYYYCHIYSIYIHSLHMDVYMQHIVDRYKWEHVHCVYNMIEVNIVVCTRWSLLLTTNTNKTSFLKLNWVLNNIEL